MNNYTTRRLMKNLIEKLTGCDGELCDAITMGFIAVAAMTVVFESLSRL